jgi:hypothetical protein
LVGREEGYDTGRRVDMFQGQSQTGLLMPTDVAPTGDIWRCHVNAEETLFMPLSNSRSVSVVMILKGRKSDADATAGGGRDWSILVVDILEDGCMIAESLIFEVV